MGQYQPKHSKSAQPQYQKVAAAKPAPIKVPGRGRGRPRKHFFMPPSSFPSSSLVRGRGRPLGSKNKVTKVVDPKTGVASWHIGKVRTKTINDMLRAAEAGAQIVQSKKPRSDVEEDSSRDEEFLRKAATGARSTTGDQRPLEPQPEFLSNIVEDRSQRVSQDAQQSERWSAALHADNVLRSGQREIGAGAQPRCVSDNADQDQPAQQHLGQQLVQQHAAQPHTIKQHLPPQHHMQSTHKPAPRQQQLLQQPSIQQLPNQTKPGQQEKQKHKKSAPPHDQTLASKAAVDTQQQSKHRLSSAFWTPSEAEKRLISMVSITDVTSDALTITVRESTMCDGFFHSLDN